MTSTIGVDRHARRALLAFVLGVMFALVQWEALAQQQPARLTNTLDPAPASSPLETSPHVTADGAAVVFSAGPLTGGARCIIDLADPCAAGAVQRLSTQSDPTGLFDSNPVISGDGSRVAYSDFEGVWVMDSDGSNRTRLSAELFAYPDYSPPSWSPTGTHITFSAATTPDENTANYDIYVAAVDGSNLTRLTTEPGNDLEPVWSHTP